MPKQDATNVKKNHLKKPTQEEVRGQHLLVLQSIVPKIEIYYQRILSKNTKNSFEIFASNTWCWNWHASITCMRCMWLFHPWYWEIKKVEQTSIESPWETTQRWSIHVIPQIKGNSKLPSRSLQGVGISQNVAVATLELRKRERIFLLWILFYCDEA